MQDASHKQRIRQADEAGLELKQHIETLVREKNHVQEKLQNVRDVKQREFQVSARLRHGQHLRKNIDTPQHTSNCSIISFITHLLAGSLS